MEIRFLSMPTTQPEPKMLDYVLECNHKRKLEAGFIDIWPGAWCEQCSEVKKIIVREIEA